VEFLLLFYYFLPLRKSHSGIPGCYQDFADWRAKKNRNNAEFITYLSESRLAAEVLEYGKFKYESSTPYLKYFTSGRIGMTAKQDRVIFTQLSFATDLVPFGPVKESKAAYSKWEKALKQFNASTKVGALKRPFASGGEAWPSMKTQQTLQ